MTQIRYKTCRLVQTPKWKLGKPRSPHIPKQLCAIIFEDEHGNEYAWFPKTDFPQIISRASNVFIAANAYNEMNLTNPEPRPDLIKLKKMLRGLNS